MKMMFHIPCGPYIFSYFQYMEVLPRESSWEGQSGQNVVLVIWKSLDHLTNIGYRRASVLLEGHLVFKDSKTSHFSMRFYFKKSLMTSWERFWNTQKKSVSNHRKKWGRFFVLSIKNVHERVRILVSLLISKLFIDTKT